MTNKEKKDWLAVKYPLTVIRDRYDGKYSGAMWLAFPLGRDEVPEDVDGEDSECMYFWKNYQEPVGKGAYANDAVKDLIEQMWISEPEESEYERERKFLVKHVSEWIGCIEHDLKISSKDVESEEELAMFKAGLAYLEKQKEQKPAGWSEELAILEGYIISGDWSDAHKERALDILKSLRPSWKPSEEQMVAFRSYIKDFQARAEAAVGGWNNFDVMIRLFEQLKKL